MSVDRLDDNQLRLVDGVVSQDYSEEGVELESWVIRSLIDEVKASRSLKTTSSVHITTTDTILRNPDGSVKAHPITEGFPYLL